MPDLSDWDFGRTALLEITSAESIGEPAGSIDEGNGVSTVYFETTLSGYPGWRWTVSIAHLADAEPSVLETELTPGDTALLSPAWVPWVDRLAEYKAAQEAAGEASDDSEHADDSEDDEDDDDDDLGSDVLHGGDVDGVDIDIDTDEELELSAAEDGALPYDGVDDGDDADDESDDDGPEDGADESVSEEDDEHEKSY